MLEEEILPELIPRKILFGDPLKYNPKISPDGKKIVYMSSSNNILNLCVKTIGEEDDRVITFFKKSGLRLITGIQKKGVRHYMWVTDRYIVYFHDKDCDSNYKIYRIELATMETKNLTPYKYAFARLVTYNVEFPYEMIISMKTDRQTICDLYHININSGKITLLARNPGRVIYWITDSNLQILGTVSKTDDGMEELSVRENGNWKRLFIFDKKGEIQNHVIGPSKDNKYIYMIDSTNMNTSSVVKMEIATGISSVIAHNPNYDIWNSENFLYNPNTYKPQAVCFDKYRKEWIILDEKLEEDFKAIKKIDSGDFSVISCDNSDNTWIIAFERDKGPVAYYLFNRALKKSSFLFYDYHHLNNYILSEMEDISFVSRDGLTIHGYITYPYSKNKNKLPLVLYVHEGPWWRNTWGYNPTVQWFANRGYICLQINYRGSTGYGKDFLIAGNREWGRKMQFDLVDAVEWAIRKGIADPERIAIYGVGYGGYAALAGTTFTPHLFCCAIAIGCPGDLVNFLQSIPSHRKTEKKLFIERIGDPETEKEFLISRSPFYNVDKIRVPVLIAHGFKEKLINENASYHVVKAIQSKGVEVEHHVFYDESFRISKDKNRIKLHLIVEKFLSKHMGGRYEENLLQDDAVSVDKSFDESKFIDKILRERDKEAFELLAEHYRKPLLKHLINLTGDVELGLELLQETFLRVWTYLYTYTSDREFFPWICKIATNISITYKRNSMGIKKVSLDEVKPDSMIIWNENMEDRVFTQSMINSLKEPYRTAMILRVIEDMDYKTIADIMNVTLNQVKKYLFKAKKLLQNSLEKSISQKQ